MRLLQSSTAAFGRARRCAIGAALIGVALIDVALVARAAEPATDQALSLNEAAALAVQQQPLLTSLDAQTRAARDAAVSSAQLPDPQLFGGILNVLSTR